MNNDAVERDDALEETTKTPRPVDPDKTCQISVFVTERVKRALMTSGAAQRMSLGRYAGLLLTKAAVSPLNSPPEKSVPAVQEGADGMTDRERELQADVDELKIMLQKQKDINKEYVDQHSEDLKEINTLRKRCQQLAADAEHGSGGVDVNMFKEKLFFAYELLIGIRDDEGRDYFAALIDALQLNEEHTKWKRGQTK